MDGGAFAITLDLPLYQPINLYPQDKNSNQISSSLLVGVTLYNAGKNAAGDVIPKAKTASVVGVPVNTPQRKHKFKETREVRHQTFMFPDKLKSQHGFTFKSPDSKDLTQLALMVYTVHEFYSSAHPKEAVTLLKRLLVDPGLTEPPMTRWPALLTLALAAAAAAQTVRIVSPANDTIVRPGMAAVSGTAPPGGTVTVTVHDKTYTTTANAAGHCTVAAVEVPLDIEEWSASDPASAHRILVTPGPDLPTSPRPVQKVFFDWDPGVDDKLRSITVGTLNTPLTPAQETAFLAGVRVETEAAFARAYLGVGVEIVTVAAGAQIVRVVPTGAAGLEFGNAPKVDFGNPDPAEACYVWVGTFADRMVNEFADWGPMAKTDTWQVRMRDVGEALGRTAAHELGHSLGLVASDSGYEGDWMLGRPGTTTRGWTTGSRSPTGSIGVVPDGPGQDTSSIPGSRSWTRATGRPPAGPASSTPLTARTSSSSTCNGGSDPQGPAGRRPPGRPPPAAVASDVPYGADGLRT